MDDRDFWEWLATAYRATENGAALCEYTKYNMQVAYRAGSDAALIKSDAELTRLRAEVSRLNGIVADLCNESRELREKLATESRAVERLAAAVGDMSFAEPGAGCPDGVSRCLMENTAPNCAACWAAWARQKEVPNE